MCLLLLLGRDLEGVRGEGAGADAGVRVVEVGVGKDGCGDTSGDDAGVSGGSGSSEAICCCTWSSSWSSGREPSRSLLLVESAVGHLPCASPGDLTNRSTSDGLAFSLGRRPSIVLPKPYLAFGWASRMLFCCLALRFFS